MASESAGRDLIKQAVDLGKKGDLEGALALLDRAVQEAPQDAVALANRGVVLYTLRRLSAARMDFVNALILSPGLKQAAEGLARIDRKNRNTSRVEREQADADAAAAAPTPPASAAAPAPSPAPAAPVARSAQREGGAGEGRGGGMSAPPMPPALASSPSPTAVG